MRILDIIKKIKQKGFLNSFQIAILHCLGIKNIKEEIDTIFYFLNYHIDITQLPPTKDKGLRALQECDALFLSLIDKLCEKHKLTYWLDYGTLLGAVRHKGFIPWDDDTDIAMPRNDFDKFLSMSKELKKEFNIDIELNSLGWIGVGYKHQQTGIWIDIFPVDTYSINGKLDSVKQELFKAGKKYQHKYHKFLSEMTGKQSQQAREPYFKKYKTGNTIIYCSGPESVDPYAFYENTIYPLKKVDFEGYKLNIPADSNIYLTELFSKAYMEFPHTGIGKHGASTGRLPLGEWAKKHNINMEEIKQELQSKIKRIIP